MTITFKKSLVVFFVLCWVVLAINPSHRGIWMMENFLVVILFPVVLWLEKRYVFTNSTFFLLVLFTTLHIFGAYTTYEHMSYFKWFSDMLGVERNYYDQVVHFLFGLLLFMTFFEIFFHQGHSRKLSYLVSFLFISSISGWYEILEWLGLILLCDVADCFERLTQGDVWDTQKDMIYAMAGVVIALLVHCKWGSNKDYYSA